MCNTNKRMFNYILLSITFLAFNINGMYWIKEKAREYGLDLDQYKQETLKKLGDPEIINAEINQLMQEIKSEKEKLYIFYESAHKRGTLNENAGTIEDIKDDLKPKIIYFAALQTAISDMYPTLSLEEVEQIKHAKNKREIDVYKKQIIGQRSGWPTFENAVKTLQKQFSNDPFVSSYGRRHSLYNDLEYDYWKYLWSQGRIKKPSTMYSAAEPTLWQRLVNWLYSKPSTTMGLTRSTQRQSVIPTSYRDYIRQIPSVAWKQTKQGLEKKAESYYKWKQQEKEAGLLPPPGWD